MSYFKKNPFDFNWTNDYHFFLEDSNTTLESHNYLWIHNLYGDNVFEKIGHEKVICAGTTFGTREAILTYCLEMCNEQLKYIYKIASCDGYDQGIHNYLVYTNKFQNFKLINNFEGPVLTMQNVPKSRFSFDSNGLLINDDGSIINILHQYDRFKDISDNILNKIK